MAIPRQHLPALHVRLLNSAAPSPISLRFPPIWTWESALLWPLALLFLFEGPLRPLPFFLRIPSSAFFAQPQLFSQCAPWTSSIPRSLLRTADPQGPPQTYRIRNSGVGAQACGVWKPSLSIIASEFSNRLLQANIPCEL